MPDGGVIALSGFRYQMLRALEEILVLHRDDPGGDWAVEVEHATDDKVDYAVYQGGQLIRAVQVKASLPGSSTRLSLHGRYGVATVLSGLAAAFPTAPEVALVSNRQGPWDDIDDWVSANQPASGTRLRAVREQRTLEQAEESVADLLRQGRMTGQRPSDPSTISALAAILEAQMWRLGSQDLPATTQGRRWLRGTEVQKTLGLRDQDLATAVGELSWAMKWRGPAGRAVARPGALSFLAHELTPDDLASGRVRSAALTGFGGLGKSMAAAAWAAEHQGLYAMVLWLTATTSMTIEADARQLLAAEHGADAATWPVPELQQKLLDWLQSTPRSWLLVLDDAGSEEVVHGWIPASGFGHVLITTRDSAWPRSHTASYEVGRLRDEEIQAMVTLRLGIGELPPGDLDQLVSLTDRWALALDMMLAWLARAQHTLADLASFDPLASRQLLLEQPGLVPVGYPKPVVVIILDALHSLRAESPKAWALLQSTVALGSEAVPVAMASDYTDDSLNHLLRRDQLVVELRSRSVASPMSIGDPRFGRWGHRLTVHDLIAQLVVQLDSVSDERWDILLERVVSVVGDAAEQHQIALVLSLGPVVDAVDQAVGAGASFSIGYLTLLGNTASVLAASGRLDEAARRLRIERALGDAHLSQSSQSRSRPVEWFRLLATLQLATVLTRLDQHGEALSLLEDAVPKIDGFHGEVNPDKLSSALEMAVDVLESIRIPGLLDRSDALLAVAVSGTVKASVSPLRLAEASLRRDDLPGARTTCERALAATPSLMEQIDLFGKLAETWAVDDIPKSDSLLTLAHLTAQAEGVSAEQPLANLQNTVRRRIAHLLRLDPEARRRELSTYRSWFEVSSLMPLADECRPWQQATISLISRAWRELTGCPRLAARSVSAAAEMFLCTPETVSPNEVLGLRSLLWGTQFASACSSLERLEPVTQIARMGSTILLAVSPTMWDEALSLVFESNITGRPLVIGHRFGPLILVEIGTWGLTLDASEFDPFGRVNGATSISIVQPGAFDAESRAVNASAILELGTVQSLRADEDHT